MRRVGRWLGRGIAALVLLGGGLWLFGPREPAPLEAWNMPKLTAGEAEGFFARQEAAFDDITQGVEKRILWAGAPGQPAPFSLLYLHGFSATSEEIRPVPDRIAAALGANLVFTRLAGHGRSSDAMGEASVADWMQDTAEALAVARAVGERVIVLSTSTGGTLAAAAAVQPALMENVGAMIFVSPNFGVNTPLEPLLTAPAARHWLPKLAGERRSFEPRSPAQAQYWTTEYPSVAALPMAALVRAVRGLDFAQARVPALFWLSDADRVVRPARSREIAAQWGGPADVAAQTMGPGDDDYAHVIAGDILSPGQTEAAVTGMLEWLARQGLR